MGALFVRRGWGCYYFGDYFDPRYSTQGYVSWCGYSRGAEVVVVRGWYDPMYSYYQVSYRNDPAWHRDMVGLYVGRFRGEIALPPRTLAQQNTVVVQANINVGNVQMLTTVNLMVKANPALRFQTLTVVERQEHMRSAREIIEVGNRRNQLEVKLVAQHAGVPHTAPRAVKVDMARTIVRTSAAHAAAHSAEFKPGPGHELGGPHQVPGKQPPPKKPPERDRERER
jgi:hypothetical protein